MSDKKQIFGMFCALTANLIFGFSYIFSKTALSVAHPLIILSTRFTVAFGVLNILMLLGIIKVNFKGKKLFDLFIMSLAQPFLYFIFELYGLKMVSSALSGIIVSLVPVGVVIASALFSGEKPTTFQFICTLVSVLGVITVTLLSGDSGKTHTVGIILLVAAVISAVIFNMLSRKESTNFTPFERTYFMFMISFVGFNSITALVLGKNYTKEIVTAFSSGRFILSIVYLAVLSSVVAFLLYNYSTTHISSVRSSSFSNIITVVSVISGKFIMKENFSYLQILICIPIILGVWGVNTDIKSLIGKGNKQEYVHKKTPLSKR